MCEHTETAEAALAGLVHENNELRAIIRRVREYADSQRVHAETLRGLDRPYDAIPHANTADALKRIIGDKP